MSKRDFEMTVEDLNLLLDASKPTPVMYLSGGRRIFDSPQENANRAWATLGRRMGFDPMTVEPTGKGYRFFRAVPTPPAAE